MDRAAYAYHTQTQMGAMAYSALAKGWFTRKAAGSRPTSAFARATICPRTT